VAERCPVVGLVTVGRLTPRSVFGAAARTGGHDCNRTSPMPKSRSVNPHLSNFTSTEKYPPRSRCALLTFETI
jgi:hypothetical protein